MLQCRGFRNSCVRTQRGCDEMDICETVNAGRAPDKDARADCRFPIIRHIVPRANP